MKVTVSWDDGNDIVFTDIYAYLDYAEKVLWSGNYREGRDYTIEEEYDNV